MPNKVQNWEKIIPFTLTGYFLLYPQNVFWRWAASAHDIRLYRRSRVIAPPILNLSTRRMWLSSFIPWPIYAQMHNTPYTLGPRASLISETGKSLALARDWTLIPVTYPVSFSKLANPDFEVGSSEGCTTQHWAVLLDLTSASGSTTDFQPWFSETWIPWLVSVPCIYMDNHDFWIQQSCKVGHKAWMSSSTLPHQLRTVQNYSGVASVQSRAQLDVLIN